eukprot:gb/GFBE01071150.1/.p1 GENE.gb/GFBE01071150.1/~~gb/GFBE01071150.1/.p1  ORF type:complete len:343 (+),score=90.19 gb/GFBE01071150.1/:1-1029(+)
MASFLNLLRSELEGTIADFREKGAIGALRDATLDAVDIIQGAGGAIVGSTSKLLGSSEPKLHTTTGLPEVGQEVKLSVSGGQPSVDATVLAVDSISQPPRVRVRRADTSEELLVDVIQAEESEEPQEAEAENAASALPGKWVIDELGNQLREAVEEVREKGAAGALKDAAIESVEIVTQGATAALDGAHVLGRKSLQVLSSVAEGEQSKPVPAEPLAPSNPTLEQMYEDQLNSTPDRKGGGYAAGPGPTPVAMTPSPESKAVPKLNLSGGGSPLKGMPKLNLSAQAPAQEFAIGTARGVSSEQKEDAGAQPSKSPPAADAAHAEKEDEKDTDDEEENEEVID